MTTFTTQDREEALKAIEGDDELQHAQTEEPRSFWNFRLVDLRTVEPSQANDWIEVCEVFYDSNGVPAGFVSANPFGETVKDIREMLYQMLEATEKSVLTGSDFKGNIRNGYED